MANHINNDINYSMIVYQLVFDTIFHVNFSSQSLFHQFLLFNILIMIYDVCMQTMMMVLLFVRL